MRLPFRRTALVLALGLIASACSDTPPSAPGITRTSATPAHLIAPPSIVISQIYGGGGNSGATLTNDFIEIFNPGAATVTIDGWSVQYASAAGTSWQVTNIVSGSIPAGGYFLVQESKGANGTQALPTPDVSGTIAMSATAGKVAVVSSTTALTGACPTTAIDLVSFGTTASNCGANTTATLTNTTAAFRGNSGCAYTQDLSVDFTTGAPAPRNSASPVNICPDQVPVGPLDHVKLTGPTTVAPGATIQLVATPQDVNNQTVTTATVAWGTSDGTIATVNQSGNVTGVAANVNPATITATATDNGITRFATLGVTVATPGIGFIDVSSSSTSFPPGFQTQLFATARVSSGGTVVPATFTFTAVDPTLATIATVEGTGIISGVAAPADGTTRPGFMITATPTGGGTPFSFTTHSIAIETPHPAPLSIYATNDEFGDPTAASASTPDDFLITRPQYTISYNQSRGTPNWVSYELDARQMVAGQDRCNCFTADPLLPVAKQILTSDYTNGGFDRGHMTRSADRTAGNTDNAATFYLTNVVPQTADLNEGVWAQFEDAIADSAEAGRAVYIITGPIFSPGHSLTFLKGEGKVAIPDSTWKVVLIGPRPNGVPFTHGSIQTWDNVAGLTILAVNMPNIAGVRSDPWQKYLTTVDRIEASTGQNYLSLLGQPFQDALEAGDHAPVAAFSATGTRNEGSSLTFDASASTDPDLGRTDLGRTEALTYLWAFGDGSTASGKVVNKAYADNGSYTATLTVSDAFGWQKSTAQTIVIANVTPTVTLAATTPLSILSGDAVSVSGGFADPGADAPWHAVLDWANGTTIPSTLSAAGAAVVTGTSTFDAIGSHTITLSVTDKDGATGSQGVTVTVARRPVTADATPSSFDITDPGNGDIKITLHSDSHVDVSTLNLSSVMIGSVGLGGKKVKVHSEPHDAGTIVLRFARKDLVDAGVVTSSTTELVVTGTLSNGIEIVSHVPFGAE
ncbi:MAG TPA: DNA/RNA non-specific endonuclease [Gemmatimonadales bacterium]|jgi:DNA/RNA endonuclease G (NUC1)